MDCLFFVYIYYSQTYLNDSPFRFHGDNVRGVLGMQLLEMCECDLICKMVPNIFIKHRPIWGHYNGEWTFSISIYLGSFSSYCEKFG